MPKISNEQILQMFNAVDLDGNGTIDNEELYNIIKKLAEDMQIEVPNQYEIDVILQEFDDNGDGVLQLNEFENLIREIFNDNEDEIIDEQQLQKQINSKKRGRSGFLQLVQQQNLQFSVNGILKLLMKEVNKTTRMSLALSHQLDIIDKSIKYGDSPRNSNKNVWFEQQEQKLKQKQSFFQSFQQRQKQYDSLLQNSDQYQIKKDNENCIYSVFSRILPQKKQPKNQNFISLNNSAFYTQSIEDDYYNNSENLVLNNSFSNSTKQVQNIQDSQKQQINTILTSKYNNEQSKQKIKRSKSQKTTNIQDNYKKRKSNQAQQQNKYKIIRPMYSYQLCNKNKPIKSIYRQKKELLNKQQQQLQQQLSQNQQQVI